MNDHSNSEQMARIEAKLDQLLDLMQPPEDEDESIGQIEQLLETLQQLALGQRHIQQALDDVSGRLDTLQRSGSRYGSSGI